MIRVLSLTVVHVAKEEGLIPPLSYMCEPIGVNLCETLNFRCPLFFNSLRRHCFLIEVLTLVVGDDIHTGVVLLQIDELVSKQ